MKKNYLLIGVAALLLSCNATKNTTTTQTTSGESALIANGKLWSSYFQQNAAEYEALCLQAFNVAQLRLDEALAKKGDKPLAIVTDIDETFLDNSPFEAYCAKQGISYSQKAWEEWTVLGEAKPLTGALEFFKYADSKGVAIFYVTNRLEKEREGTAKNLKRYNFPLPSDNNLILRSAEKSKNKDTGDDFYDVTLTVKGIITTGGKEESFIFLNLEKLNEIVEDTTKIDSIECSIEANHSELDSFAKELNSKLPNVFGSAVKRVTQSQDTVLNKLTALILLVNIVILVLTTISVSTTMMAIIAERRKEIGLKKALGAHNKEIIMDFIGESVLLGLIGGLIGVGFGFIFAQRVSLSVFGRTITFQYLLIPVIVVISVFVTTVGCILPVKKAVEIDPALVLKGE